MVTNKGAPFLSLFVVIVSVNSRSGKTVSKWPRCGGANNIVVNINRIHIDEKKIDIDSLPISLMEAAFAYDVNNIDEAVGICDYVFVAQVASNDGTQYRNKVLVEDEFGRPKEVGSAYTLYTLNVLENIKGSLTMDSSIQIVKQGGISEDEDCIFLFDDDTLPKEGKIYVFCGYAQKDGSIIVSGPRSNIMLDASTRDVALSTDTYQKYVVAVENAVVKFQRNRFVSKYENKYENK